MEAKQLAIITGGNSGIGLACAELFRKSGISVAIWDKEPSARYDEFLTLSCDVSSEKAVEEALKATIAKLGIPTICINCAGIAPAKRMLGKAGVMSLDAFKQVIEVNLIGTFNVMRLVSAAMLARDITMDEERGVIINIASIAAFEGQIGQLAYSASKGGVVSLTLPAARELAEHAIRVNAIAPGLIETPLLAAMPSEVQSNLAATVTFPKRFGRAEEVASLALEIVNNPYINGEVIRLDGALRMQAK